MGPLLPLPWVVESAGTTMAPPPASAADRQPHLDGQFATGLLSTIWGIIPGKSYPYLLWQFPAGTTPQSITGQAFANVSGAGLAAVQVTALVNGVGIGVTSWTAANGGYQILLPQGAIAPSSEVLAYTPTLGAGGGATVQRASGSVAGNDIYAGYLGWTTAGSSYADFSAEVAAGIGANASVQSFVNALTGLAITSTNAGTFHVDRSIAVAGGLVIKANDIYRDQRRRRGPAHRAERQGCHRNGVDLRQWSRHHQR